MTPSDIEAAAVIAYAKLQSEFPTGFFGDDPLVPLVFQTGFGLGMQFAMKTFSGDLDELTKPGLEVHAQHRD